MDIKEQVARVLAKQNRDEWWEKLGKYDKESYLEDADQIIPLVRADCQREIGEWGNEDCTEHVVELRARLRKTLEEMKADKPYFPRHGCYICWEERFKSGTFQEGG